MTYFYCASEAFVALQRKIYRNARDPKDMKLHKIQPKTLRTFICFYSQYISLSLSPHCFMCCEIRLTSLSNCFLTHKLQPQVVGDISHILLDIWNAFEP